MSNHTGDESSFSENDANDVDYGTSASTDEITLDVKDPRDSASEPDNDARLALLGIEVLERAPDVDEEAVGLLPPEVAARLRVVPLRIDGLWLHLAMLHPLDAEAADEVATLSGLAIKRVGIEAAAFAQLMKGSYGTTAARMAESLAGDSGLASEAEHNLDAIEADDVHEMAEQPSLINLVNLILLEAIQSRTSDVHVEPFETELKVKYRVDGVLREQPSPPSTCKLRSLAASRSWQI